MNKQEEKLAGEYTQSELLRLLGHDSFRKAFRGELGADAERAIELIEANEPLPDDIYDAVVDAIGNCFAGDINLTLCWDSDFPGGAGAVWIDGYHGGPFRLTSSDIPEEGPFASLEEALESDALSYASWNKPEVWSDELAIDELIKIATQITLFEEGESVLINGATYVVKKDKLILQGGD